MKSDRACPGKAKKKVITLNSFSHKPGRKGRNHSSTEVFKVVQRLLLRPEQLTDNSIQFFTSFYESLPAIFGDRVVKKEI